MPGKDMIFPASDIDIDEDDLKALYTEVRVTKESLTRDAVTLREWVNSQPHLPNLTNEHDEWLSMFLIVSKNLMERAKERIDAYFTTRAQNNEWFRLPPPDREYSMFTTEREYLYNTCLPKLLPGGYALYFEKMRPRPSGDYSGLDWELHFWRPALIMEAFGACCKPIRGVVLVLDLQNFSFNMFTALLSNLGYFRKLVQCIQEAQPVRIHSVHLINAPAASTLKMVMATLLPLLKDKLNERVFVHESLDTFFDQVPRKYLPSDYDGTLPGSLDEYTNTMNNFLLSKREWFESRQWMKADETKRLNKQPGSVNNLEGSFRKLDFD